MWGAILRIRNILTACDEFTTEKEILSERDFQDYQSTYLDLYDEFRRDKEADKETIDDDIEFEIELVKQVTINIDYILQLVDNYQKSNLKDKEILTSIKKSIDSSIELRSKKALIEQFIDKINANSDLNQDWREFTNQSKAVELEQIISEENLKSENTQKLLANAFRDGELKSTGTHFASILPPISMFDKNNTRAKKKNSRT